MKTPIELSNETISMLKWLRANYYTAKGSKPTITIKEIINELVTREYDKANPPEYQTTGFDRQ